MDDATDIYSEFDPPKYLALIGTIALIFAFIGTAWVRQDSAPFFAAEAVGVLCLIVGLTWPLRHRKMLWVILAFIATLHVVAITLIKFPAEVSYGILFAPLMGLDVYLFWKLTIFVLRALD